MNSVMEQLYSTPTWLNIVYVTVLLFFAMPIILKKLNETLSEYRKLFSSKSAIDKSHDQSEVLGSVNEKISIIEEKLEVLKIDDIAGEITELKRLISNNPKEILTVQRLSIEFDLIKSELVSMKGNSKWLIGTIVTLSLGVAALIVSVIASGSGNG